MEILAIGIGVLGIIGFLAVIAVSMLSDRCWRCGKFVDMPNSDTCAECSDKIWQEDHFSTPGENS